MLENTIPDPTRPDIEKPYPLGTATRILTADISSSYNVEQVLENIDYRAFTAQCVRRGKTHLSFQLYSSREETTLNHLSHSFTFI